MNCIIENIKKIDKDNKKNKTTFLLSCKCRVNVWM